MIDIALELGIQGHQQTKYVLIVSSLYETSLKSSTSTEKWHAQ